MTDQCLKSLLSLDDEDVGWPELPVRPVQEPWGLQRSMRQMSLLQQRPIRPKEMPLLSLLLSGLVGIWIGCWVRIKRKGQSGRSGVKHGDAESSVEVIGGGSFGLDGKYNNVNLDIFTLYMHFCITTLSSLFLVI